MIPFRQSNNCFLPELPDALAVAVEGQGSFTLFLQLATTPGSPRLVGGPGGVAEANLVIVVDTSLDPYEFDALFGEKIAEVVDRAASPTLRWRLLYSYEDRKVELADRNGSPCGLLRQPCTKRSTRHDWQHR